MAAKATELGLGHFEFDFFETVTHACGGKERDLKENTLPHGEGREKGIERKEGIEKPGEHKNGRGEGCSIKNKK